MIHGVPKEYDDRTYIELLIIKHTLKVAEQMKTEHPDDARRGAGKSSLCARRDDRGRLCVGNDRRGAALLLCGGIR